MSKWALSSVVRIGQEAIKLEERPAAVCVTSVAANDAAQSNAICRRGGPNNDDVMILRLKIAREIKEEFGAMLGIMFLILLITHQALF